MSTGVSRANTLIVLVALTLRDGPGATAQDEYDDAKSTGGARSPSQAKPDEAVLAEQLPKVIAEARLHLGLKVDAFGKCLGCDEDPVALLRADLGKLEGQDAPDLVKRVAARISEIAAMRPEVEELPEYTVAIPKDGTVWIIAKMHPDTVASLANALGDDVKKTAANLALHGCTEMTQPSRHTQYRLVAAVSTERVIVLSATRQRFQQFCQHSDDPKIGSIQRVVSLEKLPIPPSWNAPKAVDKAAFGQVTEALAPTGSSEQLTLGMARSRAMPHLASCKGPRKKEQCFPKAKAVDPNVIAEWVIFSDGAIEQIWRYIGKVKTAFSSCEYGCSEIARFGGSVKNDDMGMQCVTRTPDGSVWTVLYTRQKDTCASILMTADGWQKVAP